jgi:hypothetical protein
MLGKKGARREGRAAGLPGLPEHPAGNSMSKFTGDRVRFGPEADRSRVGLRSSDGPF